MVRKKILWLCSWYPGHAEPFNGDFVQRHARSAALYHDIHVIHVFADPSGKIREPVHTVKKQAGLVEEVYEFPKRKGPVSRLFSHMRVLYTYRKLIKGYIKSEGLPDLVHVHVPVWAGMAALWIKRKYKVPYVVTEHWGIYNKVVSSNYFDKSYLFRKALQIIYSESEFLISVSDFITRQMTEIFGSKPYKVIPNSVDENRFYWMSGKEKTGFLHVSNATPEKNVEGILRAFSQYRKMGGSMGLTLVGKMTSSVYLQIKALPDIISSIKIKGEVSYEKVAQFMQNSSYLIMFSVMENSPCVIGEALCCGLPVITTNVGGVSELIDSNNSKVIPVNDEKTLASVMLLMEEKIEIFDPQQISASARNKFSFRVVGEKISDQYELLAK